MCIFTKEFHLNTILSLRMLNCAIQLVDGTWIIVPFCFLVIATECLILLLFLFIIIVHEVCIGSL